MKYRVNGTSRFPPAKPAAASQRLEIAQKIHTRKYRFREKILEPLLPLTPYL